MTNRETESNFTQENEYNESDNDEINMEEYSTDDGEGVIVKDNVESKISITVQESNVIPKTVKRQKKNLEEGHQSKDLENHLVSFLQNRKPEENDPDKLFLLSLLPQIKKIPED
ncbi:uncharacterized protein LOC126910105, partial [Daktulosphaira vitifoliae]|uniref:uncharacterized protein LOC126910105 n=1 Tax=Daktulosphaira vitifoliae TaxID=58002 RepID=UPI0021AA61E3